MREELISDGHRGRSRSLTKVLVDWLFWGVCYAVGWPVCKVFTLGFYPQSKSHERAIFSQRRAHTGFTCAMIGLGIIIAAAGFYGGYLPPLTLK